MLPSNTILKMSSLLGLAGEVTITSYVPQNGKAVIVLYKMHHDAATVGDDGKPEIILHHNDKLSGVDNMDHFATMFSCKRKTNQWPMVLFYNMLEVAAITAFIICLSLNPEWFAHYQIGKSECLVKS